ncbi:hypothetical protein ELE36_05500 [Pseudolysobacter antarcticus]|uniref:Uncharacterized protein n=1 Tax=Pseudolysobacter antarcticus TaxID=2511995 RepID=A0A411HH53_9GAMM|nr:hypothetical protein [Pseudolysobacter antarcticus]QBB69866.1 hypothetical protein ELE36_05500 [Pseudolysobacter antarcticus]
MKLFSNAMSLYDASLDVTPIASDPMRTLSSIFTFPTKYIFPVALVVGIGWWVSHFMDYVTALQKMPIPFRILVPVISLCLMIYTLWFAYQLKRVRFDGTALYVSNYRQECRIPLTNIEQINERIWIRSHPVRVVLSQPCDFGTDFTFIPVSSSRFWWNDHPIVAELRNAIALAKNPPRSG